LKSCETSCRTSAGDASVSMTFGWVATQTPIAVITASEAVAVETHHRAVRYKTAGKVTTKKRLKSRHAGSCVPVIAARARAVRTERREMRCASGDRDWMTDRCVAVRWYNSISSSTSVPLSRDGRSARCTSVSRRAQSP